MSTFKLLLASDLGATFSLEFFRDSTTNASMGIISKTQAKTVANDGIDAWEYVLDDAGGVVTSPAQVRVTAVTSNATGYYFGLWGNLHGLQASGVESSFDQPLNAEVVVNVAPVFVSVTAVNYSESSTAAAYTAVATDTNNDAISYSLSGADAAKFAINANTGVVTWVTAPDYETPASAANSNVYSITITASDGVATVDQAVTITVTDASEGDAQAVVDTAAVANMLGGELTVDSLAAMISSLAVAADASDVANKTELQNQINTLQASVAAAQLAADRLESYEKGQIEELIQQLVTSPNFMQLFQTATLELNGKTLTVASILAAMANAPKVANWKKIEDTAGNMSGVIATLTNGAAVTFNMAIESVSADIKKHIFTVADFAGTGLAKTFYMVMKAKTLGFAGLFGGRLVDQTIGWTLEEQSNIVFDLFGTEYSANSSSFTAPDFNNDGALGNVGGNQSNQSS